MSDEDTFRQFVQAWRDYNGRRFFTADGSSSYERAMRTHAEMCDAVKGGRYALTRLVSAVPDYFPMLTDTLDDGLIYDMGFSLYIGEEEVGRISEFSLRRPDKVTFSTPEMSVTVRIRGMYLAKGRR